MRLFSGATDYVSAVEERFVQSFHKRCKATETQALAKLAAPKAVAFRQRYPVACSITSRWMVSGLPCWIAAVDLIFRRVHSGMQVFRYEDFL